LEFPFAIIPQKSIDQQLSILKALDQLSKCRATYNIIWFLFCDRPLSPRWQESKGQNVQHEVDAAHPVNPSKVPAHLHENNRYRWSETNGRSPKCKGEFPRPSFTSPFQSIFLRFQGWVKGIRSMKKNLFVDLNDGTSARNLQIVLDKSKKDPTLGYGCSVSVDGVLGETPQGQPEIKAEKCEVISPCPLNEGFPFVARQTYAADYVREHLHFRSRVSTFAAMLRVRHTANREIHKFLDDAGFLHIHTPILTSNDCEGAGEVFTVRPDSEECLRAMKKENVPLGEAFFDRKAFLTVSGQIHLEAMAHGLGDCYTFGPTFRAENSKSPIHLSEFYMLEAEKSFSESINDLVQLIQTMMKTVTQSVLDKCAEDVAAIHKTQEQPPTFCWLDKPFITMSYLEAINTLRDHQDRLKSEVNAAHGLAKEQELFLTQYTNSPVFVVDWPRALKPFYMKQKSVDLELVDALDFLVPTVGELVGGSVRENDYDRLKAKLPNAEALDWYLELRKYGGVPTSGFGMGFERYLQFLLGIGNIRDAIPFPRWAHNCKM
jgi:asparaginyl-tRNA synthetase